MTKRQIIYKACELVEKSILWDAYWYSCIALSDAEWGVQKNLSPYAKMYSNFYGFNSNSWQWNWNFEEMKSTRIIALLLFLEATSYGYRKSKKPSNSCI